jgi:hypothetical protein
VGPGVESEGHGDEDLEYRVQGLRFEVKGVGYSVGL